MKEKERSHRQNHRRSQRRAAVRKMERNGEKENQNRRYQQKCRTVGNRGQNLHDLIGIGKERKGQIPDACAERTGPELVDGAVFQIRRCDEEIGFIGGKKIDAKLH